MRIKASEEKRFLKAVFDKDGFSQEDGDLLADTLVDADFRGISSHGIQRLAWYTRMIKSHIIEPGNKVKVLKETPTSLLVDANKNMGQIASSFAMHSLIEKTKKIGISLAVIRNSNHFGTAGYYARMAAKQGLIGIALTNTRPLVVPTNAYDAFLGSNAFAFSFPAEPHPFVFDGATSIVSSGKIQVLAKNHQPFLETGRLIPNATLSTMPKRLRMIFQRSRLQNINQVAGFSRLAVTWNLIRTTRDLVTHSWWNY